MVKSAVFMILILDAVNRADKFVSASLIDSLKEKIESQAKKIHDEKYTKIKCPMSYNNFFFTNTYLYLQANFLKLLILKIVRRIGIDFAFEILFFINLQRVSRLMFISFTHIRI